MDINLYINGSHADIGDKKTFARAFKKTMSFSDLENPTKITTDYSYSITLPGTDVNRRIFAWIEDGTNPYNGFNPNAAYPYILNVNGVTFSEGNMQLTEIKVASGRVEYSCTFYSKVHQMLMDMSQKPLKDLTILKQDNGYMHFLDINMMDRIWAGYEQITDIIRYVPCRAGKYPNFTSSKMMRPKWTASEPPAVDSYNAMDLGTDYDEYATREYRLQYQRPAVSVDKLVKGVASDFGISMDASVMESPYIRSSWMMCPSMSVEDKSSDCRGTKEESVKRISAHAPYVPKPEDGNLWHYTYDVFGDTWSFTGMSQTTALPSGDQIITNGGITPRQDPLTFTVEFCIKLKYKITGVSNPQTYSYLYMTDSTGVYFTPKGKIRMQLAGSGNTVDPVDSPFMITQGVEVHDGQWAPMARLDIEDADSSIWGFKYEYPEESVCQGWIWGELIPVRLTFSLDHSLENVNLSASITAEDLAYSWYYRHFGINNVTADYVDMRIIPMESITSQQLNILRNNGWLGYTLSYTSSVSGSSPMYVNMDTIFGSQELSCKDFLTDLTKMLGCVWEFDASNNLKIESRNNYFQNYEVKDWTKKMDRRNVTIKPLAFDKREYTMSYKSGDSLLENNYKDLTGYDWGKQYVDTGYPFNDQTESLLETKFLNTVQCKGERTVIHANYNYSDDEYKLSYMPQTPYEIPMIEKKDNGAPNEGFRLLFNNGVTMLEKGEYVFLTQDSSWMLPLNDEIGGKCWYDLEFANNSSVGAISSNVMQMDRIPFFSTRQNLASWDFAKPQLSYSMENDFTYPSEICLYPRFWRDYMSAVYDAKTRVLTADFNLSVEDLLTFSFRNFVIIDNHLWHPNKLIDFDLSGETLTKVELVEVTDTEAWINGQNWNFKTPPRGYPIQTGDRGEAYWENYTEEEPEEEEQQ